jgi:hypothetical protein
MLNLPLRIFEASNSGLLGNPPDWSGFPAATTLQQVWLDGNSLYGSIPESYVNMQQLRCLRLMNNPGLCGAVPQDLPCFDIRNTSLGKLGPERMLCMRSCYTTLCYV